VAGERDKKTAVLVAPPKFREETSKKAGRRSASADITVCFAAAARKGVSLHRSILCQILLKPVADQPRLSCGMR
jgi:hypothetical protein